MRIGRTLAAVFVAAGLFAGVAPAAKAQDSTLLGAGAGAAAGAGVGFMLGGPIGAVIGGLAGAGVGAGSGHVIGDAEKAEDRRRASATSQPYPAPKQ